MATVAITTVLVLVVIYVVPFLVYAVGSAVAHIEPPAGASPARFLASVLVAKVGVAIAFVSIFFLAGSSLNGQWFLYAAIWWLMFVIGEFGHAIGPNYSWNAAIAGLISESIYFPLSAYICDWMIGLK